MLPEITQVLATITHLLGFSERFGKLFERVNADEIMEEYKEAIRRLQGEVGDIHTKALHIHADYEKLTKVKAKLETKLAAYERWDEEAARYELKELAPGMLVYAHKADTDTPQPAHSLCPCCFQDRKKSILQRPFPDSAKYVCHQCKFEILPESTTGFDAIRRARRDLL